MSDRASGVSRIPIIGWLRSYDRGWLRADLIAGRHRRRARSSRRTSATPASPGSRCRTASTRRPPGRSSTPIFGTSRQISIGPSSGLAAVAASAVARGRHRRRDGRRLVRRGDHPRVRGALPARSRCCKMGWIAQFLSRAVVTGFLFGAAIDVVIGELPKLTGTKVSGEQPAPGAAVVVRRRSATRTARRCWWASSRWPSSSGCASSRRRCRVRSCWWSAVCSPRGCWIWATTASPSSETCREGCPPSCCPTCS